MIREDALIQFVCQHHLFAELDQSQIDRLMADASRTALKAGEALFYQGDPSDRFYFVVSGKMRLFRMAPSGHEKVVDIVREGQCFAEALMFSERQFYPVSADALSPSVVVGFSNSVFMTLLKDDSSLCFKLLTQMSQRLHALLNEIENLSLQNALHRLVNYLLHELEDNQGAMVLDIPKRLIASQLAIQPETLSRLLRKLADAGIIEVDHKQLTLIDKPGLYRLASDNSPLRAS